MFTAPKTQLVVATALMMSLLVFAPQDAQAACKNSGGSVGSHSYSSQVSGKSVIICASAVKVTPARKTVVKVAAKTVIKKKVAKVVVTPAVKALINSPGNAVPKAAAKTTTKTPTKTVTKPATKVKAKTTVKTVAKKTVKKTVTTPASNSSSAGKKAFAPAAPNASVYPGNSISVHQAADFVGSPVVHYKTGQLLGVATEVRFTPISITWDFADGATGSGKTASHSFSSIGNYEVLLRVSYAVAYRPIGSTKWIADPDSIALGTSVNVSVVSSGGSDSGVKAKPLPQPVKNLGSRVLLVGALCQERPGAFGCN